VLFAVGIRPKPYFPQPTEVGPPIHNPGTRSAPDTSREKTNRKFTHTKVPTINARTLDVLELSCFPFSPFLDWDISRTPVSPEEALAPWFVGGL